jgi:SPP1 gp7 family putative phage head morphogenesis protein
MRATVQIAGLIDRDRRTVERHAMASAARISASVRAAVISAVRDGRDPASPAMNAAGELGRVIAQALMVSHLAGRRRTVVIHEARAGARRRKTAQAALSAKTTDLRKKLGLTRDVTDALQAQYSRAGDAAANRLLTKVADAVRDSLGEATSAEEAAKLAREAFETSGFSGRGGYALKTEFVTAVQVGYSAGREGALKERWDDIWGFEYVAEIDERTTELCSDLDGTKRPKDDPFWSRYTPPNHYNCRSDKVEIFGKTRSTGVDDELDEPAPGFDFNPGDRFDFESFLGRAGD